LDFPRGVDVRLLERLTVCKILNHRWAKVAYQPSVSGTGYFLRCLRCDKENHDLSAPFARPVF
jgi:hypothetical protein